MSAVIDTVPEKRRKPPPKGGSRKGIPNKVTRDLKEMVQAALVKAGGVSYLERCAKDPRTASAFLSLVGKTLPLTVKGAGPNGEHVITRIEILVVDPCLPSRSPLPALSSR